MSTYLHVTLEVKAAEMARFVAVMDQVVGLLEAQGWRLAGAFVQRTGRLNTVIDLWELEDFSHFDRGLKALIGQAGFPAIKAVLDEAVHSETVVFADRAAYMR